MKKPLLIIIHIFLAFFIIFYASFGFYYFLSKYDEKSYIGMNYNYLMPVEMTTDDQMKMKHLISNRDISRHGFNSDLDFVLAEGAQLQIEYLSKINTQSIDDALINLFAINHNSRAVSCALYNRWETVREKIAKHRAMQLICYNALGVENCPTWFTQRRRFLELKLQVERGFNYCNSDILSEITE